MQDDKVDDLYELSYREPLITILADPASINRGTLLLWFGQNLERVEDRVTTICEQVVSVETGELSAINVSIF
jgi:phosphate uptake regulator